MTTNYEDVVREHDPELYKLVLGDLELIPLFSRDEASIARWTKDSEVDGRRISVWASLYRELSNISHYADVMKVLNSKNASFAKVPKERLNEFIEAFPTVLWILLLQTNSSSPNAIRLLMIANRLDWVDESLTMLKEKGHIAHVKVWPRKFTKPIILALRSPEMARKLYGTMSGYSGNRNFGFEKVRETLQRGELGYAYYAAGVEAGKPISPSNWMDYMILPTNTIPENLVLHILQKNTGYNVNLSSTEATNILPGLVARGYATAVDFLLESYKVDLLVGTYPIPNIETAKLLVKYSVWPSPTWWNSNILTMNTEVFDYLLAQKAFFNIRHIVTPRVMIQGMYRILLSQVGDNERLKILARYTKEHDRPSAYGRIYKYLPSQGPIEEKIRILSEAGILINTTEDIHRFLEHPHTNSTNALLYASALSPNKEYEVVGSTTISDALTKGFDKAVEEIITKRFFSEKTVMRNLNRLDTQSDRYKELVALTKNVYN